MVYVQIDIQPDFHIIVTRWYLNEQSITTITYSMLISEPSTK